MSSTQYTGGRYITVLEGYNHLGYSKDDIAGLDEVTRARFLNWIKEANTNVETDLFSASDVTPLDPTTPVYAYAKSAALNWLVYKNRDLEGSKNASAAKDDYKADIARARDYLKKTPTLKEYPIEVMKTDFLSDYIIPYSQSNGWPPGFLY